MTLQKRLALVVSTVGAAFSIGYVLWYQVTDKAGYLQQTFDYRYAIPYQAFALPLAFFFTALLVVLLLGPALQGLVDLSAGCARACALVGVLCVVLYLIAAPLALRQLLPVGVLLLAAHPALFLLPGALLALGLTKLPQNNA